MRKLVLSLLIPAALLCVAQIAPNTISRASRSGEKLIAIDAENHLVVYSSQTTGVKESTTALPIEAGIAVRDLDVDGQGAVYLLTTGNRVSKWRAQAAGFDFTVTLDDVASAIAVDAQGSRIFVAKASGSIVELDANGEVSLTSQAEVTGVTKLRFDDAASMLYAEGQDFMASLPTTLDRVDRFNGSAKNKIAAAGASRTIAEIPTPNYTVGLRFYPFVQSVNPGGTATFSILIIPRDNSVSPYALSIDSPLPATLSKSVVALSDIATVTIPIPANQAPGVYRMVAKLDNGANGFASAVIVIPVPGSTVIPMLGTGRTQGGAVLSGLPDPNYRIVNPIDPSCATAVVANHAFPVGGDRWSEADGAAQWISGRGDVGNGCIPGLYRFRTDIDLRNFDPTTANIAVAVWADNAATLEINGVAIPSETQPDSEPETFRNPRVYAIPRANLLKATNPLDVIVRNDILAGTTRNPMGVRVEVLNATAKPTVAPEPPPVGDFEVTITPPFQFVNGTTAYYTININRLGGFAGTPTFSLNEIPPTGYTAVFNGNVLQINRNLDYPNAPVTYRFAVLANFNQTTRSVDGAFIQNSLAPVDLALYGTGVVTPGVTAPAGSIDAHYTLVASADPAFPGPVARVADELTSPIGNWILNDQFSRWISPRTDASNSNSPGLYRYQTTFDLGLGSPDAAAIALRWAADNDARVYLNGAQVTGLANVENFRRLNSALITTGFKPGINVLEFAVNNLDLGGPSPQGLRVQILGAQATRNPTRLVKTLRGQTATGPVPLVAGAFTYTAPVGVTITSNGANLLVSASDSAPLGVFPVHINFSANSSTLDLLVVIGARASVIYNVASTGQGDEGTIDPNYRMIESADRLFLPPNAYIILSNTSPISIGRWVPNNINSRWIAPRTDALLPNAPGVYRYRTTFDLSGRNLTDAMLALEWAADNRGRIELNGILQDEITIPEGYRAFRQVSITSGFVPGINTLDFVVINDGPTVNSTGLHVNILGAYAVSTGVAPGPDFGLGTDVGVRQAVGGQTATFVMRVIPNFTFDQFVDFSLVNVPAGFSWTFSPTSTKTYSTLTITPSTQVVAGLYTITVRGRWGDLIHEIPVRIDVSTSPQFIQIASTGGASPGSVDPNYKLVDVNGNITDAYVMDQTDNAVSYYGEGWIGPSPRVDPFAAPGTYRYRTTFNVTGINPSTIVLTGLWNADDTVYAVLNGTVVATLNRLSFFSPGGFLIDRGFQSGLNQLDFVVTNTETSPTGLSVKITSITGNPQ